MESNTEVKTPKLNKTNISSAFFGNEGGSASSIKNIHGTVSKLAGHVRKAVIRVGVLEKNVSSIEEKLKKEPDDKETKKENKNNFNSTLLETNKILVDIQKQLEQHFSNLANEEKQKQQTIKKEKSKKRFGMEEGALESAKRIGSALGKTTSKILSPVKGFFDKILAFLGFLAAGFLTNAVFGWLSKEENRKKLQKFFNILAQNWQLLAKIFGTIYALKAITGLVGALKTLKVLFGLLTGPAGIALIAALSAIKLKDDSQKAAERKLREKGIDVEKSKVPGTPENKAAIDELTKRQANPLTGGLLVDTLVQQTLDEDDKSKQKVKPVTSKFDVPLWGGLFRMFDQEGYKKYLKDKQNNQNNLNQTSENIEPRAMGGPVMAGRTYLVGEKGPELFSPNIDGSIVNNMRTEKIYNMISNNPKRNRKVNIQTMDLPPITVPMGGEGSTSSPSPAPSVPTISSRNILDSMRNETPGIYGIYV